MKRFNNVLKQFFVVAFVAAAICITSCSSSKVQEGKAGNTQLKMDSAIKVGQLENGMTYYIRENNEPKNRISLRLVVKAGSILEDEDQKGIAHFTEHMGFNGTEHFEKMAVKDYFESIGMQWGPELNAYTNFDETVYMIDIPADNPEIIKNSFLVLHDWACAVSFDDEEIDKERGVVIEEIRARTKGFSGRVSTYVEEKLLGDSFYRERMVLGNEETIRNLSHERIKAFYKKWYKPELMSVIAVGDIKPSVLEKEIKEAMGKIPASEKKIKRPYYKIPSSSDKELVIFKDKESPVVEISMIQVNGNWEPITTAEQFRKDYALEMAIEAFYNRLNEKTNTSNALWTQAGIGNSIFTDTSEVKELFVIPKTGKFKEALKAYIDEYERFMNFGITDSEFERLKENYFEYCTQGFKNKDKTTTSTRTNAIESHILRKTVVLNDDERFKLCFDILKTITAKEAVNAFKEKFGDRGSLLFVLAPESENLPSEKEIKDIWLNYESEVAKQKYVDDIGDAILMERPTLKGKIKSKTALKEIAATQYTFENGIKVITKKTDFAKDSFILYAGSKGGYYLYDEKEVPSAKVGPSYAWYSGLNGKTVNQINKIISSKKLGINISVDATCEYIQASGNKNSFETVLQMINQFYTKQDFVDEGWNILIDNFNQEAQNYGALPEQIYNEKINEVLFGKNLYFAPINKDYIKNLNSEIAKRAFKERFENPADFTFVIVGDFDEKFVLEMCSYYLGTLKTSEKFEETKFVYFPFPEKSQTITVKKGIDNKGQVFVCFGGELPAESNVEKSYEDQFVLNQLLNLIDIRLHEVIREDKGGTYGVRVGGYMEGWPERYYKVNVSFNCEPAREEELQQAVLQTIEEIKKGDISDEMMTKLKETFLRTYETSVRNNYWWLERIKGGVLYQNEPMWNSKAEKTLTTWITKDNLIQAANKYLNKDRVVTAYLKPEK
ncbi:MAG: insulinase family protein [Treponema sp.]|nr:insulinase family protein [Treponema sp.]